MIVNSQTAPFQAFTCTLADPLGRPHMVAIAKLTFDVDANGAVDIAREPGPIRCLPSYNGEAGRSSERFPSDLVLSKLGTDVIVVGTAHPPPGQPGVEHVDVGIRIHGADRGLEKVARVHGERRWRETLTGRLVPGRSTPLEPTPLCYENTFGGSDPRNPVGHGDACSAVVGGLVPPIEDIDHPLDSAKPRPAGFGVVSQSWQPRRAMAGTYDEHWARTRAPDAPEDYNPRFASCASDGLHSEQPLSGTERVDTVGLTPDGPWSFSLPGIAPRFFLAIGGPNGDVVQEAPPLDTLIIDADTRRIELVWRLAVPRARIVARKVGLYIAPLEHDLLMPRISARRLIQRAATAPQ